MPNETAQYSFLMTRAMNDWDVV